MTKSAHGPLRVGIGGPVGSGKTTLTEKLCKAMRERYSVAAITNDASTEADALILDRLQAVPEMRKRHPGLDVIFIESGGDNLAATFSPDLADISLYVISVCQGEKIPRKGGPAITRSDLLVINKADLAPHVMADLGVMEQDTRKVRGGRPYVFTDLLRQKGLAEVVAFIERAGGLGGEGT